MLKTSSKPDKKQRRLNYLKLQQMKRPNNKNTLFGIPINKESNESDDQSQYWWFWRRANKNKEKEIINKKVEKEDSLIEEREWRQLVGMNSTMPEFNLIESIHHERLRKSILNKVPDSLRGEIWCMICQTKREKAMHAPGFYEKLLTIENPEDEHRI